MSVVGRRVARRLYTCLRCCGRRLSRGYGGRGRSLVFLQLPRCVRRVAVIRRSPGNSRNNRQVFLAVAVVLAVTGVSRCARQDGDAKNEHESARKPQFHVSPSY